jgi:hypothetical protein
MSSINRFPWQDDILRGLHTGEAASIDDLADVVSAHGHESGLLREEIAVNVDHLVHLGLAEYAGGDRSQGEVRLTPTGVEAAASLP